ncbi:IS701 family transposase [Streptomyces pilosus]|uniref:IS701 family transposase n=1 Tax=Streptomyces pilosus TaxID=28893 RepID=UPI001678AD18|nr:transposase [Streptomyces pilosus]
MAGAGQVALTGVDPEADVLADLSHEVLHSLARRDQRRSGELYIRGLLTASGRKTIRNIASHTGVPADAQRLHHFISDSTWHWGPVRAALARHMAALAPPRAWVVHTATLPRTGHGGVGTDHIADPRTGRSRTAQRAVGLWAASERGGYPVDWHLRLSSRWLGDARLREQAAIPAGTVALDALEAGLEMVLDSARTVGAPHRPVLLDARQAPAGRVAALLGDGDFPCLLRISGSQLLTPLTADGRGTGRVITARQLAGGLAPRRFGLVRAPGLWTGHHEVARVPCRAADTPPGPQRRQLLLAQRDVLSPLHTAFWLTDLTDWPTSALVQLAAASARVARDASGPGRRTGLYDFEGRTFAGWHRHVTLASAAHAAALLLHPRERGESRRPASPAGRRLHPKEPR